MATFTTNVLCNYFVKIDFRVDCTVLPYIFYMLLMSQLNLEDLCEEYAPRAFAFLSKL